MNARELLKTDDATERRIAEGIEKNRKGDFRVRTSFAPGTRVHIKQTKHDFHFGANLFMLGEFIDREEKNGIYEEKFRSLFNTATLPFYWDSTEPEEGRTRYAIDAPAMYRRPPIDRCLAYCQKYGIEPREHALCYDHFFPAWLEKRPSGEVWAALEKRVAEVAARYGDRIPTMEVTNEMFWEQGKTEIYRDPDFVVKCFHLAEKYMPGNILGANDGGDVIFESGYRDYLARAMEAGARIDRVGIQYHLFGDREHLRTHTEPWLDKARILSMLDGYAALGKPIEITEITVPAFSAEAEDEEMQADLVEALYSVWFSHPTVEKIIYWNLVDGYAFNAEPGDMTAGENYLYGGLLRFDMTEKPAFCRLKKLFGETWHTELDATVGADGTVCFRGFYGEYELTAEGRCETASLRAERR